MAMDANGTGPAGLPLRIPGPSGVLVTALGFGGAAVVGWAGLTAPHVAGVLEALRSLPGGDTCVTSATRSRRSPTPTG